MDGHCDVVVLSGVRTPIGKYGGSLKDFPPTTLGGTTIREALCRARVKPDEVGHVVFGNVIHTDAHDMYLSRVAAIEGGIPVETPAFTLNRLCGSGLQAIVSASQLLMLGDAKAAVAGGAEVMSRGQYWLPGMRWGQRMNDGQVVDAMVAALTDPFDDCHMGITAENVATKWGISREDQDALAVESHHRAEAAIDNGYFKEQIVPIEVKVKGGTATFDTDEHVRRHADLASMAKLRPAFDRNGTVTPGNASGINDAAAAVVLMERGEAEQRGLEPLGRLVSYAFAGVDPKYMGVGPVPAVREALAKEIQEVDLPDQPGSVVAIQADVSNKDEATRLMDAVWQQFGRLDILVNNAGVTHDHTFRKMTVEEWEEVIGTDLNGVFYCTHAAMPYLLEHEGGKVINIGSAIGLSGNIGQANYAAAKAGLIGLTKSLALEWARYNITVNCVAPGFTETDMLAKVAPEIREQIYQRIPLHRFGSVEEVASLVRYLCTEGGYITGQVISVNGGLHL